MITDSAIAVGDQLGAQMITYANLYFIARENSQKLVFWEELISFRRGMRFFEAFDLPEERIMRAGLFMKIVSRFYCKQFGRRDCWEQQYKRIYKAKMLHKMDMMFLRFVRIMHMKWIHLSKLKNGVHVDQRLKYLDKGKDYDILNGFSTYQDWKKYGREIKKEFQFKKGIKKKAEFTWKHLDLPEDKEIVSVHFRRTDYLIMASLNLSQNYYREAFKKFDQANNIFLIFSDDIDGCKSLECLKGLDVKFMPPNNAAVDMCLMTKCNHNIIANSTFSFWGAYLNQHKEKKVVCPYCFIGESCKDFTYMNGNWYPSSWIAIKEV